MSIVQYVANAKGVVFKKYVCFEMSVVMTKIRRNFDLIQGWKVIGDKTLMFC
jgi:hypothetical protein